MIDTKSEFAVMGGGCSSENNSVTAQRPRWNRLNRNLFIGRGPGAAYLLAGLGRAVALAV